MWAWVLVGGGALFIAIVVSASHGSSATPATPTGASVAPSSPAPSPSFQPSQTTLTAGMYQVGADIAPGRYKTSGGAFCGWSRDSSDDGQLGSIIANDIVQGPGSMTVKSSDKFVQFSGDCTWVKQ